MVIEENKVLNDDKTKLLQIVKNFRKSLMEKIGERLMSLPQLHLLKNQIEQALQQYVTQDTKHKLALSIPKSIIEGMQSWLKALTKKDLATITLG